MIYLEMSRVETHGGGAWEFPNCLWSPTKKENGSHWPFWEKVLSVKEGDTVLHLRGVQPNAFFVGYSRASSDGFITSKRPPDAGAWSFSDTFNRTNLDSYTRFFKPISLTDIFSLIAWSLRITLSRTRHKGRNGKIFFTFANPGGFNV